MEPYAYSYDTFLGVFGSCDVNDKIAENDDLEDVCGYNRASAGATVLVQAGQTIYITWPFMWHNVPHAWDGFFFSVDAIPATFQVDFGPEETVFYGYDPEACVTISPTFEELFPPYTYLWSTGETTESITVCPEPGYGMKTLAEYSVIITDSRGFSGSASMIVDIIDIRCGKKNDKVLLCVNDNNPHTICVSPNSVPAHLAKGATLGDCGDGKPIGFGYGEFEIKVYPNPNNGYFTIQGSLPSNEKSELIIRNILGQTIYYEDINLPAGQFLKEIKIPLIMDGMYFLTLRNGSEFLRQTIVIN